MLLLAGMLLVSAGCRTADRCSTPVAQATQPLPYSYSDNRNMDKGAYFKRTTTEEFGHHDRSRLNSQGGNNLPGNGGEYCPPGQASGPVILTGPGTQVPGSPGGSPPTLPGTIPAPGIPTIPAPGR